MQVRASAWSGLSRIASRYAAIGLPPAYPAWLHAVAEVVVGLGVVGLEPDRLTEFGIGVRQLAPVWQRSAAEVDVGARRRRA